MRNYKFKLEIKGIPPLVDINIIGIMEFFYKL